MTLLEALKDWREPFTGAVSNVYKPGDYSCDNGIDFSAVEYRIKMQLGICPVGYPLIWEFDSLCIFYERPMSIGGELMRHPTATTTMSWDDHTSAAALSRFMAQRIRTFGEINRWTWDKGTKKLWRFPIFIPTVYASADGRLNVFLQALAALAYVANCFEGYEHTSGKKSLWIAQEALYGKGFLINKAIDLWRWVQQKRYPGGIREVFSIYFPPQPISNSSELIPHPYSIYAPKDFK